MRRLHGQHIQRRPQRNEPVQLEHVTQVVPPSTLQTMYNSLFGRAWTQNELWSFKNYRTARLGWQLFPDWLNRSGPLPQELQCLIQAFLFCQRRWWFLLLGFLGAIPYPQVANLLIVATLQHQPPTDFVLMSNTGGLLVTVLAFLWTRT